MGLAYKEINNRRIVANDENCNGCLICQLRCSYRFEKKFNVANAAIKVDRFTKGANDFYISFTDQCDACGICAKHCPYEALSWIKQGKEVA